jgi:hypothetical protein
MCCQHLAISYNIFSLKPFSGSAHCGDEAEKWLENFHLHTSFRKMAGHDKSQLFMLLMTEQAADWLWTLPADEKTDTDTLVAEFKKRYELTRVDKWHRTAEIRARHQKDQEPVEDYMAHMQNSARIICMSESSLIDAILQGLRTELRFSCYSLEPILSIKFVGQPTQRRLPVQQMPIARIKSTNWRQSSKSSCQADE